MHIRVDTDPYNKVTVGLKRKSHQQMPNFAQIIIKFTSFINTTYKKTQNHFILCKYIDISLKVN